MNENMRNLRTICEYISACEKWIMECPLISNHAGDALYETYGNAMEGAMEDCRKLAEDCPDEAIRESILGFIDEGEYGEFQGSWKAWKYIATMIKETK